MEKYDVVVEDRGRLIEGVAAGIKKDEGQGKVVLSFDDPRREVFVVWLFEAGSVEIGGVFAGRFEDLLEQAVGSLGRQFRGPAEFSTDGRLNWNEGWICGNLGKCCADSVRRCTSLDEALVLLLLATDIPGG